MLAWSDGDVWSRTRPEKTVHRPTDVGTFGDSGDALLAQLTRVAGQLHVLRRDWEQLALSDNPEELFVRHAELREALQQFGDPNSLPVSRLSLACADPVIAAFRLATRAFAEAQLASRLWAVASFGVTASSETGKEEAIGGMLVNVAVQRLRLLDLDGSYTDLQRAHALGSFDPRLRKLSIYCAQLRAAHRPALLGLSPEALGGEKLGEALLRVRDAFLDNGFRTQCVLTAVRARSLAEFIYVHNKAHEFDRRLSANPVAPSALADLIRLFLMQLVVPLPRLCQVFG